MSRAEGVHSKASRVESAGTKIVRLEGGFQYGGMVSRTLSRSITVPCARSCVKAQCVRIVKSLFYNIF